MNEVLSSSKQKKNTINILIQRSEFLAIEHLCFEDHEDDF
jgi:hypothetical protein